MTADQFSIGYGTQSTHRVGIGLLIFLAIVVLLASAGVASGLLGRVAPASHAVLKHGSDAVLARQCLNGSQHFYLFKNPTTNRYGTVCEIDGMWGVVISDSDGNEITAFVKNKMARFDQVVAYMRNAGYSLVSGQ